MSVCEGKQTKILSCSCHVQVSTNWESLKKLLVCGVDLVKATFPDAVFYPEDTIIKSGKIHQYTPLTAKS